MRSPSARPAWIRCPEGCEDYWCQIHQQHVFQCDCPPVEEWEEDPYVTGAPVKCSVCQDDGWLAYPTWADEEKKVIRIRKVACPRGCPLADPDEKGVLPAFDGGGATA